MKDFFCLFFSNSTGLHFFKNYPEHEMTQKAPISWAVTFCIICAPVTCAADCFFDNQLEDPPQEWLDGHLPLLHDLTRPRMLASHIHPFHNIQLAEHRDLFFNALLESRLNTPLPAADLYLIRDYYKDKIGTGLSWGGNIVGGIIGGTIVGNLVLLAITLPTLGLGLTLALPLKVALGFAGSQMGGQLGKGVGRYTGSKLSSKSSKKHKKGFRSTFKGRQQSYFETRRLTNTLSMPLKIIYLDAGMTLDNALNTLLHPLSWSRGTVTGRLTRSLIKRPLKVALKQQRQALLDKTEAFNDFLHNNAENLKKGAPLERWD